MKHSIKASKMYGKANILSFLQKMKEEIIWYMTQMIIPNEWFPEKFLAIEMIKKCKMNKQTYQGFSILGLSKVQMCQLS